MQSFLKRLGQNLKLHNRSVALVYTVAILVNLALFIFIFSQVKGVQTINNNWTQFTKSQLIHASQLAKVESDLGYVGFIHYFKNYVIRGDELDYERAISSYDEAINSIRELESLEIADQKELVKAVKSTLEEYYRQLQIAKNKRDALPLNGLDLLIRVDDSAAEAALTQLRQHILPLHEKTTHQLDDLVVTFTKNTILAAILLFPIFLMSTFFTVRLLKSFLAANVELETILDSAQDGIIFTDKEGKILRNNKTAADIFGYTVAELSRLTINDLVPEHLRSAHTGFIKGFMQTKQLRTMSDTNANISGVTKDGTLIDLKVSISSTVINGKVRGICVIRDITQLNQLREDAYEDPLTGAFNRRYFSTKLDSELARHHREQSPMSMFMIDLDRFKTINDRFGHAIGDEALIKVAHLLRTASRNYDCLARWGGDEFVLLCPNMGKEDAIKHAARIRDSLKFIKFEENLKVTLSIGISSALPEEKCCSDSLFQKADAAVYAAKEAGRDIAVHYNNLPEQKIS